MKAAVWFASRVVFGLLERLGMPSSMPSMPTTYCCDTMTRQLNQTCDQHEPEDCPDSLIAFWPKSKTYGLRIHDGGTAIVVIDVCPWCGADLHSQRIDP